MDTARFPSASSYLASLPAGLAAHPECLVKGSVVRELLETPFAAEVREGLPEELVRYYEVKPVATSWVPEVHMHVFLHAAYDRCFAPPGRGGEAGFLAWGLASNRALFSKTIYRVLFFVTSPQRLFLGFEQRWATFRRGSTLHVQRVSPNHMRLTLRYPAGLYTELIGKVRAGAFEAAAECAGGKNVRVLLNHQGPGETEYSVLWT